MNRGGVRDLWKMRPMERAQINFIYGAFFLWKTLSQVKFTQIGTNPAGTLPQRSGPLGKSAEPDLADLTHSLRTQRPASKGGGAAVWRHHSGPRRCPTEPRRSAARGVIAASSTPAHPASQRVHQGGARSTLRASVLNSLVSRLPPTPQSSPRAWGSLHTVG